MLALRRDSFVLPLFQGDPKGTDVFEIGVGVTTEEIEGVRHRLPASVEKLFDELAPDDVIFRDPYGFKWHLYDIDEPFVGGGDSAGRWLDF